jgi:integrase
MGDEIEGDGGKRIRALVELMRWTGLRIGDAVTLMRDRLFHSNGMDYIIVGQHKLKGEPVCCAIPPHVAEQLRTVPPGPKPNPRFFFWSGNGKRKSVVTDWQRSLARLFKLADLKLPDGTVKRAHPHMLRDTFAVESLLAGQDIKEVSMLLGHKSVLTTEESYMPWVRARQMAMSDTQRRVWEAQGVGGPPRRKPGRPRRADVVEMPLASGE